jgi:hypothetical protein
MEIQNPKKLEADENEMLLASVYVKRQTDGSGVVRENMTPAELVIVAADGRALVKGTPIKSVQVTGVAKRTKRQELGRLRTRFSPTKVKAAFPGADPVFPETFEAALEMSDQVSVPTEAIMTIDLATP